MLNLIFYFLFLTFSLGMFSRISFWNQQINGYLYEIVMLVALIILVVQKGLLPITSFYKKNQYFFWFFLIAGVSFFFDWPKYFIKENLVSFLYLIRLIFYFVFFIYLRNSLSKKIIDFFILVTAIISIFQYFLYPDLRNLIYAGWDPHLYRMFGTYLDTYVAVTIYGLSFLYLFFQKRTLFSKIFLFCYLVFIIMTFSRLGYLATLATLTFVFIKDLKKLILFGLIAGVIIILVPKPWGEGVNLTRYYSIDSRVRDYQKAISIWKKSPLIGIGYNRIRYIKKDLISHSGASFHSSFMLILATTGIIGFILFFLGIGKFATLSVMAPFYLLFVCLVSLGDNALLHPFILFLLLSLLSFNPSRR